MYCLISFLTIYDSLFFYFFYFRKVQTNYPTYPLKFLFFFLSYSSFSFFFCLLRTGTVLPDCTGRLLKTVHNRHVLYCTMKHWVLSVARTNHRHFTWIPTKLFKPHTVYQEDAKRQEQMFMRLNSNKDKDTDISKKEKVDVDQYNNAFGAYERASSYISKNKF